MEPRRGWKWRITREFGWTPDVYDSLDIGVRDEIIGWLAAEKRQAQHEAQKAAMRGGGR